MRDWFRDDDEMARKIGVDAAAWRGFRQTFIERGLLRPELHPEEGPILRFTHPEHIVAAGILLGRL